MVGRVEICKIAQSIPTCRGEKKIYFSLHYAEPRAFGKGNGTEAALPFQLPLPKHITKH